MHSFLAPVANPPKTFIIPWINKVNAAAKGKMKIQPFWAIAMLAVLIGVLLATISNPKVPDTLNWLFEKFGGLFSIR